MTSDAKRYYATLGVDPTCSDEGIRLAFRRRAKELHPDSEGGSASAFIRLKRAYDTLSDPGSRARYDAGALILRRPAPEEPPPLSPRFRPVRSGGISFVGYAAAFVLMAGLSYGAIELMISLADVPPGATIRAAGPSLLEPRPPPRSEERSAARGSESEAAHGGFWDPASPDGTPQEPAAGAPTKRPRAEGLGAWPGR